MSLYRLMKLFPLFNWILLLCLVIFSGCSPLNSFGNQREFNGNNALKLVKFQVDLGPRIPGTPAHQECINWIGETLLKNGWLVEKQSFSYKGIVLTNVIAKNRSANPDIILGAHFDTRMIADQDPDPANRNKPVPGANDGASGVAVLLELSRILPLSHSQNIWLVFFDAEDQGNINDWDWIIGSRFFARSLPSRPKMVVILDMIGDRSLNIHYERNSNVEISQNIWAKAAQLGYQNYFIQTSKHSILDDHTPFLEIGIPAVDIIDFDYPYWHTISDTIDKVSAESLRIVGKTMYSWLMDQ